MVGDIYILPLMMLGQELEARIKDGNVCMRCLIKEVYDADDIFESQDFSSKRIIRGIGY
jgi:hypothetical protein